MTRTTLAIAALLVAGQATAQDITLDGARSGDAVAQSAECGAARQHGGRADPLGDERGGNLERRHGAAEDRVQETDRGIAQAEFGLPDRLVSMAK
jgi:hypothetical protein